jgi:hypothetical protein
MRFRTVSGPGARIIATLLLVWGGVVFQPGIRTSPSAGSRAVDQITRSVTRPVPKAPAPRVTPQERVWVPDRYVAGSDGLLHVPGHWERRVNEQEVHTPPVVACPTGSGECVLVPSGIRPEPDARPGL